jgi:hypothetical protein
MKRRASVSERNVDRVIREVALIADRELVLQTPVDTGRARSNWIVTIGSPATEVIPPYSPGSKGSSGSENANAAIAQGSLVIAQRRSGEDISISNNVPYIGLLNQGSSAQAPAQFVQAAVQRAVVAVRKARVL